MTDLYKKLTTLIVICLSAFFLFAVPGYAHDRESEIEQEKAALRAKIRDADRQSKTISGQIAQSDARRAQLETKISGLAVQLAGAEARLQEAEAALGIARGDLLTVESSLAASLRRLDDLQSQLDSRVRDTYKAGPAAYLQMLTSSESVRDFVSRLAFVRKVMTEQRSKVDRVKKLTDQLSEARAAANQRKIDIEAHKTAVEAEKENISHLRDELAQARQGVLSELSRRKELLKKVQAEKAEYLRQMQRLEEESRSIAAMLRSRQKGQTYEAGSGRRLAWPTTGYVSSGYGWRTHPIFGDRRFHAGIDISAPAGQAVVAADAGEVIFAGNKGGYGLVVIIDHGNALATLYAHLSSASVASGTRVSRGARIAAVGCTGYCTGPHLHFETRIKGDPVDPMQFF